MLNNLSKYTEIKKQIPFTKEYKFRKFYSNLNINDKKNFDSIKSRESFKLKTKEQTPIDKLQTQMKEFKIKSLPILDLNRSIYTPDNITDSVPFY